MLTEFVKVVSASPSAVSGGLLLSEQLRPQAQYIFEFMELLVKPMVNTFVADPRLSVTDEVIKFVKQTNLPKLAL
jgi:hypothetical protein